MFHNFLNALAVILVVFSLTGCDWLNLNKPDDVVVLDGKAHITNVDVQPPSGTISEDGMWNPSITASVSVGLPDNEYVSIFFCFSAQIDIITMRCGTRQASPAGYIRKYNPVRINLIRFGTKDDVINYLYIIVFSGIDDRYIYAGSPIPDDNIGAEVIPYKITFTNE